MPNPTETNPGKYRATLFLEGKGSASTDDDTVSHDQRNKKSHDLYPECIGISIHQ